MIDILSRHLLIDLDLPPPPLRTVIRPPCSLVSGWSFLVFSGSNSENRLLCTVWVLTHLQNKKKRFPNLKSSWPILSYVSITFPLHLFLEPVSCLDSAACCDRLWPQGVSQSMLFGGVITLLSAFAMSLGTGLFRERLQREQVITGSEKFLKLLVQINDRLGGRRWGANKHVLRNACLCDDGVNTSRLSDVKTLCAKWGADICSCAIPSF